MKAIFIGMVLLCRYAAYTQTTFTIHFDFNKFELTHEAKMRLDSFLLAEKESLPTVIFQLNGYCDSIGPPDYNDRLSANRVAAVKEYFVKKGIRAGKIGDEISHGEKDPLNENKTEEERQLNRRVEISLLKVMQTNSLKEKIADTATTKGTTIVLRNINFVGGRHQFLEESYPALQELLEAMKLYPKLVIEIQGHICCESYDHDGPDLETGTNNLSEERAKAVYSHLITNGIEAKRLSYKGFGHSAPIYAYPEQTEEERIANRRVEIKIISK